MTDTRLINMTRMVDHLRRACELHTRALFYRDAYGKDSKLAAQTTAHAYRHEADAIGYASY